ncbi:MAG: Flp family type IVb pilin [Brevundimonas sp.]
MRQFLSDFLRDRSGATSIEYGLISALMAVVIIAVLSAFGPSLKAAFVQMGSDLATPPNVTNG